MLSFHGRVIVVLFSGHTTGNKVLNVILWQKQGSWKGKLPFTLFWYRTVIVSQICLFLGSGKQLFTYICPHLGHCQNNLEAPNYTPWMRDHQNSTCSLSVTQWSGGDMIPSFNRDCILRREREREQLFTPTPQKCHTWEWFLAACTLSLRQLFLELFWRAPEELLTTLLILKFRPCF